MNIFIRIEVFKENGVYVAWVQCPVCNSNGVYFTIKSDKIISDYAERGRQDHFTL